MPHVMIECRSKKRRKVELLAVAVFLMATANRAAAEVDFERDVFPLLQRHCIECHGSKRVEANLRLDERAAAFRGGDSGAAIAPKQPENSELLRRIALPKDDAEIMPARGEALGAAEIQLIRDWIAQGAEWPEGIAVRPHWAYLPPRRPALPEVKNKAWPRTPIDYFILARLEREGLPPSPEADRAALARRLSLDLTGLPPAPAEIDAFLADPSPQAYEKLVDRLLASPQFGVRWARPWLDAARYADSHGFQRDDLRDVWAYRDWVVQAFNDDKPFDRFTVEQLAGDLLPPGADPRQIEAQKIATGFNRNAPTNVEAGSDPEETRVNQVFDRVNTIGMAWLGTTLECCQCHDHKYDPFTMRDYYSLFACFNNTAIEAERTNPKAPGSIQFRGPSLELQDDHVDAERRKIQERISQVQRELDQTAERLAKPDEAWEAEALVRSQDSPRQETLEIAACESQGGATCEILDDRSVLMSGEAPDRDTYTVSARTRLAKIRALRLDVLTDPSLPGSGPGRGDEKRPNFVLHSFTAEITPAAGGETKNVKFAGAEADFSQAGYDVAQAVDDQPQTAWAIAPKFREPHWAVFAAEAPVDVEGGAKLTIRMEQNFGGARTIGRFRLSALTGLATADVVPAAAAEALHTPRERRTPEQNTALAAYRRNSDAEYRRLSQAKSKLENELAALKFPTTLVMEELPSPRASAIFVRGDFRSPGEPVQPDTPAALPPLAADATPRNRLALARWLVDGRNPLTARVTVNRWWAELFGHGIVTTPEDFGVKGQPPTHPELLDWLAVEYVENGWSLKRLLRSIVLSSTYRQSSRVTPGLVERDDQNLLYARGTRFRLDAEAIRDNALAIAGLLNPAQGGPPVRPYQPDGLWVKVGGQRYDYVVSPGAERHRRGLYVVWKRGAPYPSMVNFDSNGRFACRVKRPRSNTPLQALTLLNDPVYVEAALALARRTLEENPHASVQARIAAAFRLATARLPHADEAETLGKLYEHQRDAAQRNEAEARKLLGAFAPPAGISLGEFAGWYAVAAALLNLDETISKG